MSDLFSHHVILSDEDRRARLTLSSQLKRSGLSITALECSEEILPALNREKADLVLFEPRSAKAGGASRASEIFENTDIPIILLTSPCRPEDRVHWLEMGATDCLSKSVPIRELKARIANVLRRAPASRKYQREKEGERTASMKFADFIIDKVGRSFKRINGEEIHLTRGEFDLLLALVEARGRTLSREQLGNVISRSGHKGQTRTIDVLISRIRRKIEDNARKPKLLRTKFQDGYYIHFGDGLLE